MNISESDWKKWKKLRLKCIDDFCHETFSKIGELHGKDESIHDKHRQLYQLVTRRDREIGEWFDPMTRSRAIMQLLNLYREDRISDSDLAVFSDEFSDFIRERK